MPLSMEKKNGAEHLAIGNPGRELLPGVHIFVISYNTDKQVRHYNDYDMIAWNVTGSKWSFPIDSASCVIELPAGAKMHNTNCHTGASGSTETNCSFEQLSPTTFLFQTNEHLNAEQGLTVSVSFNKGLVSTA